MMFQQDLCELACWALTVADPVAGNDAGDSVKEHSSNAKKQDYGQSEK